MGADGLAAETGQVLACVFEEVLKPLIFLPLGVGSKDMDHNAWFYNGDEDQMSLCVCYWPTSLAHCPFA